MPDDYFGRKKTSSLLFTLATVLLVCGAGVGLALTFAGKPAGLGLVALFAAIWGVGYLARRKVTGGEL
ncbi:hypothetical protein GPA10_17020 [Streptomyces sp. p1417]|uniref:Uncharacterized protein n=1 Tax=Streptomyces typhae TaxID=2681492 RepID=A0A6L6WY42_9ACTN|nr:hypothetical protein [Streptomyces typhae]MVO86416.1 hypothetical protein [Streptomyces typhae]